MPVTQSQLAQVLAANAEANSKPNEAVLQSMKGQQAETLEKLKSYLGSQQGDKNLQSAQQYIENNAKKGRKVSVSLGADGQTSLTQNDPSMYAQAQRQQFQNAKAEQQAYQAAAQTYQHGVGTGATSIQALHTMLGALQSNDASSMGQIRTAMVLANGFKRYNDNEGTALTPDDKQADVSGLLSKYGIGLKDNTLSDTTRSNVTRFANNKLDDLQDAHNTLKAQAQQMYSGSSFADPTKAANLGSTLGSPVDQQLQQMKAKFDEFHSSAIPNTPPRGGNAPSGGLKGLLGQLWNGSSQQSPQSTPQAPQQQGQQAGGITPRIPGESISDYQARVGH